MLSVIRSFVMGSLKAGMLCNEKLEIPEPKNSRSIEHV